MIRAAALLGLGLGLAGCVAMPLSTMVRMSTFDEQDFARLDPDVVRVRIKLPQGFDLDAARSSLGVRIASGAGVHHGEFKLEQVMVERAQLPTGLWSAHRAGTAYTLRLTRPSSQAFAELQTFVRQGRPGDVVISIAPILAAFPPEAASVNVWVELLLSRSQGYFTLLEAAEIPMEAIRRARAGT